MVTRSRGFHCPYHLACGPSVTSAFSPWSSPCCSRPRDSSGHAQTLHVVVFLHLPLPGFLFNHAQDGRELLNMRPCPKPVPWSPSPDTLPISCQPHLGPCFRGSVLLFPDAPRQDSTPFYSRTCISDLLVFFLSLFSYLLSFSCLAQSLLDSGNLESVVTIPFV